MLVYFILEIICPVVRSIKHAKVAQRFPSIYSDFTTVICDQGYRNVEGGTALILQCMANSAWNYSLPALSCEGQPHTIILLI